MDWSSSISKKYGLYRYKSNYRRNTSRDATKTFGLVCIPVYSKVEYTAAKLKRVVDTVFNKANRLFQ